MTAAPLLTISALVSAQKAETERYLHEGSGPLADLALTLPLFIVYHLGVVWLDVQNAADVVTRELKALADSSLPAYSALTLAIGAAFVGVLLVLGRGHTLRFQRFALVAIEGVLYAIAMRLLASYVVGKVQLDAGLQVAEPSAFTNIVLSLGAGFYEEIAFRVVLFGLGLRLIKALWPVGTRLHRFGVAVGWALSCAAAFSGWHYLGDYGEAFELRSFVFRWVCGAVFTLIYAFRGFAPVVWTHALYDVWVLSL